MVSESKDIPVESGAVNKIKISKKKKEFFAICEKCDIKNKFFENK